MGFGCICRALSQSAPRTARAAATLALQAQPTGFSRADPRHNCFPGVDLTFYYNTYTESDGVVLLFGRKIRIRAPGSQSWGLQPGVRTQARSNLLPMIYSYQGRKPKINPGWPAFLMVLEPSAYCSRAGHNWPTPGSGRWLGPPRKKHYISHPWSVAKHAKPGMRTECPCLLAGAANRAMVD